MSAYGWETRDGITSMQSGPFLLTNKKINDRHTPPENASDIHAQVQNITHEFIKGNNLGPDFQKYLNGGGKEIAIDLTGYKIGKKDVELMQKGLTGLLEDFKQEKANSLTGHLKRYLDKGDNNSNSRGR